MAPNFDKQFKLYVDASEIGMGAVLLQEDSSGVDHPVCYYSRKFDSHQRNYLTVEKKTLALVLSLQHFEVNLSSTIASVEAFTDYNPLVCMYVFKHHHVRGCDNVALSRSA